MSKLRLLVLPLIAVPGVARAEFVYNNLTNPVIAWLYPGPSTAEFGDRITIGGSARELSDIVYWLRGPGGEGSLDATFRVYGVDPGTQMPGTLLSTASVSGFLYNNSSVFVSVSMPTVTLPDEVFVTAQITASTGGQHGFTATAGPTTGTTDADFWYENQGGTWMKMGTEGAGWGNVGMRVNAVPEPATMSLLALGLVAIARRRHR